MNTLLIEEKLAQKYNYAPLPKDLSAKYRQFFADNIPDYITEHSNDVLCTRNRFPVCNGYNRIVVGDYGAFVEFAEENTFDNFSIKKGQEYRVYDPHYCHNVKYDWLTICDGSDIKIYRQKKRVTYADYVPGMYYVSVHELFYYGVDK